MSLSLRLSVVALAAGVTLIGSPSRPAPAQQPAFTIAGTWRLNREKTAPPKETQIRDPESVGTTRARTGQSGSRATSTRGSTGGGGGGDRTGGGGDRGTVGGPMGLLLRAAMRPADSLLIAQDEQNISIDSYNGYLLALQLDGTPLEASQPDGSILKSKATLKKDQLVLERDLGAAGNIRELYRFEKDDTNQLVVEFKFENKRQRRTVEQKRVYDKAG